jgi:hypothetical protein
MKVLILYRPDSEFSRVVEEFVHDFQSRHNGQQLEVLNIDSREGSAAASLYDVMQHPAILVIRGDGYLQKSWAGERMPLIDEVVGYTRA